MKKRQYRSNQGRSPEQEYKSMMIIKICLIVGWTAGIISLTLKLV